ncbi:hypothetical protein ACF08O_07815 [Streptomyces paradoxus]|uniref:hypothetical protein n=1 Tax=Streptomyces paradoxus TaxID=66375 RepID=UPI0036FAC293
MTPERIWNGEIVGRDGGRLPQVVAVADALLDPAMAQLMWTDSGAGGRRRVMVRRSQAERCLGVARSGGDLVASLREVGLPRRDG